jgi:c-di-AMP phosphodiesterase-like protein
MQNSDKKFWDNLVSRTKIYIIIIFILLVLLCINNYVFIIPSALVFAVILVYTYLTNNKRKSEISETIQELTSTVDTVAKSNLIDAPFPLVILETSGKIIWKNIKYNNEFQDVDMTTYLNDIAYDIKNEIKGKKDRKNSQIEKDATIGEKSYKLVGKFVKSKNKKEYTIILYFIDETENVRLQKEYKDSKTCITMMMIDNYEETMQQIDNEKKPQLIAELDKCVYEWTSTTNGVLIKTDKDRYVYLFEQRYLEAVKEDKFSILDKIKEVGLDENIQFTLSIAVSNDGMTDNEKYKSAQTAMDIVLGRGGDQAVIRENEIYKFFGGRAQEVEKRTKVKARVVAQSLENLIKDAKNVMIMGHANPDIDALGSAMGIYRLAKTLGKEAYIINSDESEALTNFKECLLKEEEYKDLLISKEVAMENIDSNTLLVVVDTHKIHYVESPELLTKTQKIVIIDHHRRSTDYIENALLTFQEAYASSAAELVTEILQYVETKVVLKTFEVESLYAGIMMDTKNFTFKTGVRTFEAAAYLRKCGVDIIRVKKWFQSDLASFNKIADIVKNAEIIYDTIAVALYDNVEKDANLVCAKAADELLTISDITASFVIGDIGDKICISGRSIGDVNVQIILEKLGGGGHMTLAGAQLDGITLEEAKQQLIERINEYFAENGK